MSHPVWNRDYFYLNGKVAEVREYMRENCVHTVAEDLLALALDIFSRYDNRRRMGVEVMVLTMLATPNITKWEVNKNIHLNQYWDFQACHNCDILFVKMLELGSEIIPKN